MNLNEALDVLDRYFDYVDQVDGPNGMLILNNGSMNDADQIAEAGAALLVVAAWKRQEAAVW